MKLNCDLGESFGPWKMGADKEVMPFIDQANIACGFHASDPLIMDQTVKLAKAYGVSIGAHPSYPDLQGFGRRNMALTTNELQSMFIYQIGALRAIAKTNGVDIDYVKPHGALYNQMMKDESIMDALMFSMARYDHSLPLMIMATPNHEFYSQKANQYGVRLQFEAFTDRAYDDCGLLVSRAEEGAVLTTTHAILEQMQSIVIEKRVKTINGIWLPIHASTLCLHGDNPLARVAAQQLRQQLLKK